MKADQEIQFDEALVTHYCGEDKRPIQVRFQGYDLRTTTEGKISDTYIQIIKGQEISQRDSKTVTNGLGHYFFRFTNQPIVIKMVDVARDLIANIFYK